MSVPIQAVANLAMCLSLRALFGTRWRYAEMACGKAKAHSSRGLGRFLTNTKTLELEGVRNIREKVWYKYCSSTEMYSLLGDGKRSGDIAWVGCQDGLNAGQTVTISTMH